eukprot:COSAG01_NODE_60272_length_295_cov_1.760204_1_plen_46_part_10
MMRQTFFESFVIQFQHRQSWLRNWRSAVGVTQGLLMVFTMTDKIIY